LVYDKLNWKIRFFIFLEEERLLDIVIIPHFTIYCHILLASKILILDPSCEYVTLNVLRGRRISYLTLAITTPS
jgi:hypothetical protein